MKKFILFTILISVNIYPIDYQYQYFNNEKNEGKYMPFSDYIPRVRKYNYTAPAHVEDYYLLYGMSLYYNENDLRENIRKLKKALTLNFRHPTQALCKISTEKEYYKYRNLMFMRINILIMRSYMKIATRYDKRKIYFYDVDYGEHLLESFDIAEKYYKEAIPYWTAAKKHANIASKVKLTTDLSNIESERYSIITGEVNYQSIISNHLGKLEQKKGKVQSMLNNQGSN